MKIYLVRHGSTKEATEGKRQSPHSPLGEEGVKQAQAAAKRLAHEEIDSLLSSNWQRAKETAEIISSEIKKPIQIIEGIHEKESNPLLYGVAKDSEIHKEHDEDVLRNWGNIDWKFREEGESIRDVVDRVKKLRDNLIENFTGKNVVVVSHSAFIRTFVTLCALSDDYTDRDFIYLWSAMPIANTSISLMEYDEYTESNMFNAWTIRYLNDHLHLRD